MRLASFFDRYHGSASHGQRENPGKLGPPLLGIDEKLKHLLPWSAIRAVI
jgi:hypothetical protein